MFFAKMQRSIALVLLVSLAGLAAEGADPPVRVERIRTGINGAAKIGRWAPVRVDLMAGPEGFRGSLEISAGDDDGTPAVWTTPLSLAPNSPRTEVGYVRLGSFTSEVVVRVLDEKGKPLGPPVRPDSLPGPVAYPRISEPTDRIILGLGKTSGLELVARPESAGQNPDGRPGEFVFVSADPSEGLTGQWIGLDAVSALVLDTNDAKVVDLLRTSGNVLREWTRQGGHLILSGAANWQVIAEFLGDMLPSELTGTTTLNDLGAVESFCGSTSHPLAGDSMIVAALRGSDQRGGRVLASSSTTALVVRGTYGFGRVTLIGLNVDQNPFASWPDRNLFWVKCLGMPAAKPDESAAGASGGAFFRGNFTDLTSILHSLMDQPPGVTLIPFGTVAFFVLLYILLIGPGDYLFLKKILGRMEWTWVTFPLIVLAVSLLAYLAAYRVKGSELKVVKLDALDVDQQSGFQRGRVWATLFSPANRDYDLGIVPTSLLAAPGQTPVLSPNTERLMSWFGPPEPRIGGGGIGAFGPNLRGYRYSPNGRAETIQGARIPIWSTKSFAASWSGPAPEPYIQAELLDTGGNRLDGSITNLTARTLRNSVLLYHDQVYDQLGNIPPGGTVRVGAGSRTRPLSGFLEERSRAILSGDRRESLVLRPGLQKGQGLSDLLRTALFRGAMNPSTVTPQAVATEDLDLSGHLQLGLAVLVADLDVPAAELALGGNAPAAKRQETQTTVLRVLLRLRDQ